jgi:hypothetical protein
MSINKINKEFLNFEEKVINPLAGEKQRKDMKDAFYGGAMAVLTAILTTDSESDEDFILLMDGMHDEIKSHYPEPMKNNATDK